MKLSRLLLAVVFGLSAISAFAPIALADQASYNVLANVPKNTGLGIVITEVDSKWDPDYNNHEWGNTVTEINFTGDVYKGENPPLTAEWWFDTRIDPITKLPYNIFRHRNYYAVDIDKGNPATWDLTNTTSNITHATSPAILDYSVIVTFMQVWKVGTEEFSKELAKTTYAKASKIPLNQSIIPYGWPRLFVGVANGDEGVGEIPISNDLPAGNYGPGTMTLTLTAS